MTQPLTCPGCFRNLPPGRYHAAVVRAKWSEQTEDTIMHIVTIGGDTRCTRD
jgi:hypothetical protein